MTIHVSVSPLVHAVLRKTTRELRNLIMRHDISLLDLDTISRELNALASLAAGEAAGIRTDREGN